MGRDESSNLADRGRIPANDVAEVTPASPEWTTPSAWTHAPPLSSLRFPRCRGVHAAVCLTVLLPVEMMAELHGDVFAPSCLSLRANWVGQAILLCRGRVVCSDFVEMRQAERAIGCRRLIFGSSNRHI